MAIAKIEPWMFLLASVAVLTLIFLRITYRRIAQRRRAAAGESALVRVPRPQAKWSGSQRDIFAEISRREVEMHELARELTGQLDNKIIILQQLVAECDKKIEEIRSLLDTQPVDRPFDR